MRRSWSDSRPSLPRNGALAENLLFNTPPVERSDDHPNAELRSAPQDWREQSREQKAAVNQFHIAAIAEQFRGRTGKAEGN